MKLEDFIDRAYDDAPAEKPRTYIGASGIGHPCNALQALSLRGFPDSKTDARLQRIFNLGHAIEALAIEDLRMAGYTIADRGSDGKQPAFDLHGGHVTGHVDGVITELNGQMRLLEIKSMNADNFVKFSLEGVAVSHPRYWLQAQFLMGLSDTPSLWFVAYNKNTSEYCSEMVAFDEFQFAALMVRVELVLAGEARRIAAKPSSKWCERCFKRDACWSETVLFTHDKSCTHCLYAVPTTLGTWHCSLKDAPAVAVCSEWSRYQPLPKEAA